MTMQNPQTCLSAELLRQLSHDELSPAELKDVEDHVSDCERCRQLLEVPQSDPQWQDEIVPILRTPLESPHVAGDHDERGCEGESLESILRLLGPTDDPHMLGRIGSYEVVGVIGRGGMGVVFKAYEGALNRFVAIKMLLPHLAASGAARKRFAREGQAAAAVIDDNVMPIYSVAEWQGVPYLVTQYSRGATLEKRIRDQGPLELKEILRIGMQTARGLAAAHAQGLVHRDVKPSNILLDGTVERALLTDFGLARAVDDASITRTGIIAGTPQYMSPEQAHGSSVDARSDLFGLGCVLYAMCTGRPPFRADSSYAILRMITDDEPRSIREINPDIPEWLCLLISRLMAKSPDARFGNALEVAALLEQCLAHVQQPTSVPLPASLVPHTTGRRSIFNSTRKGMIAMIGTIGMTLLGMVLWQATEPPDISGQWTGDEWGTVVLEAKGPGQYVGTFGGTNKSQPATSDPGAFGGLAGGPAGMYGNSPGKGQLGADAMMGGMMGGAEGTSPGKGKSGTLHLKWSRVERRFNGTWGKGSERSGTMSLRLDDKEIRGGWTTDEEAQLESGTPLLADLLWTRKREANVPEAAVHNNVRLYAIQDLPLWSKEGTTQNIDLLIHYLTAKVDSAGNGGDKIGTYDAGRGVLVVRGDTRKHQQIAQVLSDLRASSRQPVEDLATTDSIADLRANPVPAAETEEEAKDKSYSNTDLRANSAQSAADLAKETSRKIYSVADLPIWSKDGKKQHVDLLLSYLRLNVDPPSWESKVARAAYNAEMLALVVHGTPEVHNGIEAAISGLRGRTEKLAGAANASTSNVLNPKAISMPPQAAIGTRGVVTVPDGGTVLLGSPKRTSEAARGATGVPPDGSKADIVPTVPQVIEKGPEFRTNRTSVLQTVDETVPSPLKIPLGDIRVDVYAGRGLWYSKDKEVFKLLHSVKSLRGVTFQVHEDGKGDAFTNAVVYDPAPVRAEPAENQKREERIRTIKIAIDEALRAHKVPNVRWLDANGNQQDGPVGKVSAPPTNMAEPEFAFGQPQRVLNVSQVLKEGRALIASEEVVVVRFRVATARANKIGVDTKNDIWETFWELSSEPTPYEDHPLAFRVNIRTKALEELKKNGVEDIAKHFVGKILEVEGPVQMTLS